MLTADKLREFGADVDAGLTRCMNNEAFYITLVGKVIADNRLDLLRQQLADHQLDAAFETAHALKGMYSNLSLDPLTKPVSEMTELLRPGDLMIITADHGCDPCDISTDHTRENIPILAYTPGMTKSVDLGIRSTFADIAATCADWLGLPDRFDAESFADALR